MPVGFATAKAEIENSKSRGGGSFFKIEDGDSAVVRFVNAEPAWAWVHQLPKEGNSYRQEVCTDQDMDTGARNGDACRGCELEQQSIREKGWKDREHVRKMSGVIYLIQRDAPAFAEDKDGKKDYTKAVGTADQVVRWTFGKRVIEELDGKAATYKDLTNRDFTVSRKGKGFDTEYSVEPVLDDEGATKATPMSEADKTLAGDAPDLNEYFRKNEYDNYGKRSGSGESSDNGSAPPPGVDASPFAKPRS